MMEYFLTSMERISFDWFRDIMSNGHGRIKHRLGCLDSRRKRAGFWNRRLSNKHSNYWEHFNVLMWLKSFQKFLAGKTVHVLSDNVTTVLFIEHMGGSQRELDSIARSIHVQAMDLKINLKSQVRFQETEFESRQIVKTRFNIRMDVASEFVSNDRQLPGTGSRPWWQLSSRYTTQCFLDPLTSGVDALTSGWMLSHRKTN